MEIPALDRGSGTALSRQIAQWFGRAALEGRLAPGEELPSTRSLAEGLCVSRNVVCEAYELLAAEGYILCSAGRRPRVAPGLALAGAFAPPASGAASGEALGEAPGGRRREGCPGLPPVACEFRTGIPDPDTLPRAAWARALLLAAEAAEPRDWLYGRPEGLPALRSEIAAYLFRARGMAVPPERVFVTSGATGALHVLSLALASRGARVAAVEDPCHLGLANTLRGVGLEVAPVEADERGMRVEGLAAIEASLAYVTPSHQFPLGGVLPAERRAALLRWARERGALVVEDDYDSEFRYSGPPVAPLWSLDPESCVYIGTFSKTLFPAIRVGYALVPPALEEAWRAARTQVDVQNPSIPQAALARLLERRDVDRHVARMRRIYARRRAVLLDALRDAFGGAAEVLGDGSGLHVAVRIPGLDAGEELALRARGRGLRLVPASRYSLGGGRCRDTILLGYGAALESRIAPGVAALAAFLRG